LSVVVAAVLVLTLRAMRRSGAPALRELVPCLSVA
jgi:hypothetical protein